VRLFIDAMFSPQVVEQLNLHGYDAISPGTLGLYDLPYSVIVAMATEQQRVIVTESAKDFAWVTTCPVLIVLKSWWPAPGLPVRMAASLERWATATPEPGLWPQWLEGEFR
jgi:uncharacterized protein DUF5615